MRVHCTQRHAFALAMIVALAFAAAARPASAASGTITCTASNNTIAFGAYDVLSGNTLDSVGTFTVNCNNTSNQTATVTWTATVLPPGTIARQLASASTGAAIQYDLYVDSARTQEWGDGTGGTFTISGSLSATKNRTTASALQTYYGRITPGGQDVSAASDYAQTLTVTVNCTGGNC